MESSGKMVEPETAKDHHCGDVRAEVILDRERKRQIYLLPKVIENA